MSIPEGYAKLAVIGIAWKGEYADDGVYHKMNGVCYEGSTYIALKDNPSGPPAHDGTNWQYLAKGFAEALMSACTATDTQGLVVEAGETTNAQTLMDSIADKVVTLDAPTFEDYTGETEVPAAAAALENIRSKGKVSTLFSNIKAFCKGCCTLAMIVDNCVTDNAGLPLSAAQGKALMDLINQTNSNLNDVNKGFSHIYANSVTWIKPNTDLNDITELGTYSCASNSIGVTLKNRPNETSNAFMMLVANPLFGDDYKCQILRDLEGHLYTRRTNKSISYSFVDVSWTKLY